MQLPEINKIIEELYLHQALAMRTLSCSVDKEEDKMIITAFQCNMAYMKTTDIKLPTVIRYTLDENYVVVDVELMENFKGSQGIPCSQGYLNQVLKERVIGVNFKEEKNLIREDLCLKCRHTYEVTAASMTFLRYLLSHDLSQGSFYEETRAMQTENGLFIRDVMDFNGTTLVTEENVLFSASDLSMSNDGKVEAVQCLKVEGQIIREGDVLEDFADSIEDKMSAEIVIMSIMKLFNYPWKRIGQYLGIKRDFYCSNLVPSSLYGVFVQAIALIRFPNNYNYFQHAMAGLQRNQNVPLCAGMVVDFTEVDKYFPGLKDHML